MDFEPSGIHAGTVFRGYARHRAAVGGLMADEWVRMRVNLVAHPKLIRLAELLLGDPAFLKWSGLCFGVGSFPRPTEQEARDERYSALRVTRYVCVTALLRFWGHANEHAKGEFVENIGPNDVDEITGIPNFGVTLVTVGWAIFRSGGGVDLPGFAEHNTPSAKRKSTSADRQKAYRERKKLQTESVTPGVTLRVTSRVTQRSDVTSQPREEKRREEKTTSSARNFLDGAPEGFVRFWQLWQSGPRKAAGAKCLAVWREKKLEKDAPVILAHVASMKESRQWRDGYDPAPLAYLRNGNWIGAEPVAATQQRMVV